MQIAIRQAGPGDAEIITDLSRSTFYETFASQNTREDMDKFMSEQFSREALMKEVESKENIFLLAFLQQELAGYAKLREEKLIPGLDQASIEIARIYAITNKIGKGIGSALMQKCIDFAKEKNKMVIWLGVWKENKRAIDFYRRWGFEIFGEQDFILGNDRQLDWLMKKTITGESLK